MSGIDIGMEEAHGDRFGLEAGDLVAHRRDLGFAQWQNFLAPGTHALISFDDHPAPYQRSRAPEEDVIGLGTIAARDEIGIARARGGDENRTCAGLLDQRVDRDRRAVHESLAYAEIDAALRQAILNAKREIFRRGRALGVAQLAALIVEVDEVCKCAANVER